MALGNNDWFLNFTTPKLLHLNFIASDHCPVLLITDPIPRHLWIPFKFFRSWIDHGNFNNTLERSWNLETHGSPAHRDRHDISTLLTIHFSDVASTSNPILPDNAFYILPRIILDVDNVMLTAAPSEHEIENVVKHMLAWSAPAPDGFQAGSYQTQWQLIGNDIIHVVQRIRPFLKKLISPYQAAFVPRRAIHDNIIIAHEIIHSMKHKEGLNGTMTLKLDLSKAFGRLEWNILIKVLDSFGFSKDFCNLIMQCVSTTSISVLLNGSPCDQFEPTRGVRQGDPLSPYLFILAMEYLSSSLLVAETNKTITGIKVSRKAPPISHLLFDDDILIFGQANMQHVDHILHTLQEFRKLSGQILNFDKSYVYFSNNLSPNDCVILAQALNMSLVSDSEKYLGAPLLLGHSKIKSFDPIMQSFEARLTITLAPLSIKQILTEQDELWVQILNAKYFYNSSILHLQKLNDNCSWIWRNIYKCIEIIKRNSIWDVRCGTKVKIWLDNWVIGLYHPPLPAEGLINTISYIYVSDLFIHGTRDLNVHLVYYLFSTESAESILAITILDIGTDNLIWMPDRKGQFSVKSAYNVISSHSNANTGAQVVPSQHGSLKNWVISWFSAGNNLIFGSGITRKEINKLLMVLRRKPPDCGYIKINLDASFLQENFQGGIRLIARNFAGKSIGA
ncbi:uncharacterized protein LOC113291782 [Papaver somniferum]|uniref:uncharacterized protein LOC113291782 n=1 Tax=Papaver somniferum TaxID=3469 RepID=UPI000E7029E1|nr:uncharacterized protein LOC113291782 [Papaver somniferum]